MTRFFSENNLPALLTRLKALDDQLYEKVVNLLDGKVDVKAGYQLTQEDFTTELKNKLERILVDSSGNLTIPTKLSQLENDMGFQTNAIESITIGGETITADSDKTIDLDTEINPISLEDINMLFS